MKLTLAFIVCSVACALAVTPRPWTRGSAAAGAKYALVIGIKGYPNFPSQERLEYADKDAREFAAFIQTPQGGGFPAKNVRLLVNESAHRSAILSEIRSLGRDVGNEDWVYVYFAGHGLVDDYGQAYFMPYDSEKSAPSVKGIRADLFLQELNTKVSAKHLIVFVDACHAAAALTPNGVARGESNITSKLLEMWDRELGRRDGVRMGIFSASSNERSWEDRELQHGLFTFYLLEGLRGAADANYDLKINARELYAYVADNVESRSRERFTIQTPARSAQFDAEFQLAVRGVLGNREAVDDGGQELCHAVSKIVEASREDSTNLYDKSTAQGSSKLAVSVPGFGPLNVSSTSEVTLSRKFQNRAEVEAEYDRLVSKLNRCFPRWGRIKFPEGLEGDEIGYRRYLLSEGDKGPAIEISHSLAPSETVVMLTVISAKSGRLRTMRMLQKR